MTKEAFRETIYNLANEHRITARKNVVNWWEQARDMICEIGPIISELSKIEMARENINAAALNEKVMAACEKLAFMLEEQETFDKWMKNISKDLAAENVTEKDHYIIRFWSKSLITMVFYPSVPKVESSQRDFVVVGAIPSIVALTAIFMEYCESMITAFCQHYRP